MIEKLLLIFIITNFSLLNLRKKLTIYIKIFIKIYILHNYELVYKIYKITKLKKCNNVTVGVGAKSFQSKSQMTIIIQNFILVSLAFIIMPHPAGLLFRTIVFSRPTHLITYLTPHCLYS